VKETPTWMVDAICKKKNGDIWFPPFETTTPELYYAIAKRICNVCPVWEECRNFGIKETFGVWGGLTPQERIPLQKEGKIAHLASHGTITRYRQGCNCDECEWAHTARPLISEVNLGAVPNLYEELTDLKMLLEEL